MDFISDGIDDFEMIENFDVIRYQFKRRSAAVLESDIKGDIVIATELVSSYVQGDFGIQRLRRK